jgi:hypothetical protein
VRHKDVSQLQKRQRTGSFSRSHTCENVDLVSFSQRQNYAQSSFRSPALVGNRVMER